MQKTKEIEASEMKWKGEQQQMLGGFQGKKRKSEWKLAQHGDSKEATEASCS